jgi:hypothetical protein
MPAWTGRARAITFTNRRQRPQDPRENLQAQRQRLGGDSRLAAGGKRRCPVPAKSISPSRPRTDPLRRCWRKGSGSEQARGTCQGCGCIKGTAVVGADPERLSCSATTPAERNTRSICRHCVPLKVACALWSGRLGRGLGGEHPQCVSGEPAMQVRRESTCLICASVDGSLWQSALNASRAFHPSGRNRWHFYIPLFQHNNFAAKD